MQKDEELLLRPWLLYYGYLFGFENLYVYDNGSVSPAVQATLKAFEAAGVHVDYSCDAPTDFEHKGLRLGAKIKEFQAAALYDVVLPLDCDEFIAINGAHGFACDRTEILAELQRISDGGTVCRITKCLENNPGYADLFHYATLTKSIVPVSAFLGIDHGFHQASLPPSQTYGQTSLIHIHMHFKPFAQVVESAKNKLAPFVDVTDKAALDGFEGVGVHLKKYFFMSNDDYYSLHHGDRWPFVRFRGLEKLLGVFLNFSEFRLKWEVGRSVSLPYTAFVVDLDKTPFVTDDYYKANGDLPRTAAFDPFEHFLNAGFIEGRRLGPSKQGYEEVADRMADIRRIKHDGESGFGGLALTLASLGRIAEAEQILKEGIETFGRSRKLLRESALLAMHQGKLAQACEHWEEYRSLFPDDVAGYHFSSSALRQNQNYADAGRVVAEGLKLFPNSLPLAIEQAELASAARDLERANDLWQALLENHPHHEKIRKMAVRAAYELRLQRMDQSDQFMPVDAMDGPVTVQMSEAETKAVLKRFGFTDAKQLRDLFIGFESLGYNCEFGLVQRRYGAEPIGLLRWNSIDTEQLTRGLKNKFSGIADPENLIVEDLVGEYILKDLTYKTVIHTFTYRGEVQTDQFLAKQIKRMEYLRQKLVSDLEEAEKIFVYIDPVKRSEAQIEALWQAFRARSTGMLLYVQVADEPSKVATVEDAGDGFLLGYIGRLGKLAGQWDIDFESWLTICEKTAGLRKAVNQIESRRSRIA